MKNASAGYTRLIFALSLAGIIGAGCSQPATPTKDQILSSANAALAAGQYDKAEKYYRESLLMFRRLYVGDHPSIAAAINNLALVLYTRGDLAGAELGTGAGEAPLTRTGLTLATSENSKLAARSRATHPDGSPGLTGLMANFTSIFRRGRPP